MEVVYGINFLQVVNTTFYTTTMDFSDNFSLKNHNSHIRPCSPFFIFTKLFISNCYYKKNTKHEFYKVCTYYIVYLVCFRFP
jgi:hypothetical protein